MTATRTWRPPAIAAVALCTAAVAATLSLARASQACTDPIAFDSDRDGNSEIYVMNADGSSQQRLTFSARDDAAPAWEPSGERIAFASNRDGNWEIYKMSCDGSNQTRLTSHPAGDYDPVYSPDGTQIAFESFRDGNWNVYVMGADGTDQRPVTGSSGDDWDPVWLDNSQLAYASVSPSGGYATAVVSVPSTGESGLPQSEPAPVAPGGDGEFDPSAQLTSSGDLIGTAVSRLDGLNYEIYFLDPSTGDVTDLTASSRAEFSPVVTTDGRVVFVAEEGGDYEIYSLPTDGSGELRNLTGSSTGLDLNPAWNPAAAGGVAPRLRRPAAPLGPAPCQAARGGSQRIGDNGANTIVGGPGRDALCGLGGNDTLRGKKGADHLDGGQDSDTQQGGRGPDRLLGKDGFPDTLNGGNGQDRATADEDGRDSVAAEAVD
jgi:hypothetical protein